MCIIKDKTVVIIMEFILHKYESIFLKNIKKYIKSDFNISDFTQKTINLKSIHIDDNDFYIHDNIVYKRYHCIQNINIYKKTGILYKNKLIVFNKI